MKRFLMFLLLFIMALGYSGLLTPTDASGQVVVQTPLNPKLIPKFVDPLPGLDAIVAEPGQIELRMTEFQTNILPTGFVPPGILPPCGRAATRRSGVGLIFSRSKIARRSFRWARAVRRCCLPGGWAQGLGLPTYI